MTKSIKSVWDIPISRVEMIHDLDYSDEFNYHAVVLIFGRNSPKVEKFVIYSFDVMSKHRDLNFSEISTLTPENVNDIIRRLRISDSRYFITNDCKMSSGVSRKLTFVDSPHKISVGDNIFSTSDYEYYSCNWDATIKNKIRTLGMLMRSVYEGKMYEIPLLMNEYPNITGVLFKRPDIWVKNEPK